MKLDDATGKPGRGRRRALEAVGVLVVVVGFMLNGWPSYAVMAAGLVLCLYGAMSGRTA